MLKTVNIQLKPFNEFGKTNRKKKEIHTSMYTGKSFEF